MNTLFTLSLKSASREPFLLFWSIFMPIAGTLILGYLIHDPHYSLRITTGMMAMGILFYAFTTTVFTLFSQRRRGVYQLLKVTPLPLVRYIISLSGAGTIISLSCGLVVLIIGSIAFQISLSWPSLIMIMIVCLLGAMGYLFLSFFISSLCKTEAQASIITNLISMPLLLSSDAFYSLDGAPAIVLAIRSLNPFQWFLNGLRSSLMVNPLTWGYSLLALTLFFAITLTLAIWSFTFTDR